MFQLDRKRIGQVKFIDQLKNRFPIMSELPTFFWERRSLWMIPMVIVWLALDLMMLFACSGALVPFLYPLF